MEIYSFKLKSKNNANVFFVDTSEGEFVLHSDIIVNHHIEKGSINDNVFHSSVEESAVLIAFNLATKYISSKLKTEQQIKDYLYKKDFHKTTVETVIEKLKDYKIIDDKNYAETYAKSNPSFSKNKLKQKLFSVGVKANVVDESLTDVDDYSSCLKNAEKYMRNKVADKQTIEKLIRRLQSMGYNWDSIKSALNKLKCDLED